MIRQHFVRAFERGAWHDHRPNIWLKRGSSQVFHGREDSTILFTRTESDFLSSMNVSICVFLHTKTRLFRAAKNAQHTHVSDLGGSQLCNKRVCGLVTSKRHSRRPKSLGRLFLNSDNLLVVPSSP